VKGEKYMRKVALELSIHNRQVQKIKVTLSINNTKG